MNSATHHAVVTYGHAHVITPTILTQHKLVTSEDEARQVIRDLRRAGVLVYDRMDDDPEYNRKPTHHRGETSYRTASEYDGISEEELDLVLELGGVT